MGHTPMSGSISASCLDLQRRSRQLGLDEELSVGCTRHRQFTVSMGDLGELRRDRVSAARDKLWQSVFRQKEGHSARELRLLVRSQ